MSTIAAVGSIGLYYQQYGFGFSEVHAMTMAEEGYAVYRLALRFGRWGLVTDGDGSGCTRRIIRGSIKDG